MRICGNKKIKFWVIRKIFLVTFFDLTAGAFAFLKVHVSLIKQRLSNIVLVFCNYCDTMIDRKTRGCAYAY